MVMIFKGENKAVELSEWLIRDSLPKGRAWALNNRFGNALIKSMAACLCYLIDYIHYTSRQSDINTVDDAIDEHEESVGLPDACSIYASSLEIRRQHVKYRLINDPIVTAKEVEVAVKDLTGFDVVIKPRRKEDNIYTGLFDYAKFDSAKFLSYGDLFTFDVFVNWQDSESFDRVDFFNSKFDGVPKPTIVECIIEEITPANSVANYIYSVENYERELTHRAA